MSSDLGKNLIIFGLIIVGIGVILSFFHKGGTVPKLPGDILIKKDNFTFYFPWLSSLLISAFISLILYLLFKR